jgi:replicative DNA helicase
MSALPSFAFDALQDIEAEKLLLAALLYDNANVDRAAKLRADDFSEPVFGRIFDTIRRMVTAGSKADVITVSAMLATDPQFAELGGRPWMQKLVAQGGVSGGITYLRHVRDLAQRRAIVRLLSEEAPALTDQAIDIAETIERIETLFSSAIALDTESRSQTIAQAFDPAMTHLLALSRGEVSPGLMTGLSDFDEITGGLKPGQYILLGGRPSMGKTALALSIARRAAQRGYAVLFISREMEIPQLMPRVMADLLFEAGGLAGFQDLQTGKVSADDFRRLERLQDQAADWPLYIDAPSSLSAGQIAPLIRRYQRKCASRGIELGLVILDYLGLVDPPPGRGSREQEVAGTSLAIKNAAASTRVPIITLSQLNRSVEQRDDKRPQISDLRDSGSLEQDADIIVFVYRDEYYLDRAEPPVTDIKKYDAWRIDKEAARNKLEIYSAKHRQGALTRRTAYFFGHRQAIRSSDFYRTGGYIG